MMRTTRHVTVGLLAMAIAFTALNDTARGAIVANGVNVASGNSQATAATYTPDIVSTDLIDASQPTLSSWTWDQAPFFESTTLNDGIGMPLTGSTLGSYLPATLGSRTLPFVYTFTLDTTVNTRGYDISEIRTFAGWNENGSALGDQKYTLYVRMTGTSAFVSLGTFTYAPFNSSDPNAASATKVTLAEDSAGMIATGVDAVRFVFLNHGFANVSAGVDGTVYYEVDVIGTPTATDPITVNSYSYDGNGSASAPSTSPAWPDSGGVELTDGILPPTSAYANTEWVGFKDDDPDDGLMSPRVRFDLGGHYDLNSVRVDYLQNGGVSSITPPDDVRISVSKNGSTWTQPDTFIGFDNSAGNDIRSTTLSLAGSTGRYVRVDFRNATQWTFLAEVTFAGTAVASPVLALPVDVPNGSFQTPAQASDGNINSGTVDGWTESGGTIGNFNPNQSFYLDPNILDGGGTGGAIADMDGNNVLFFFNAGGHNVAQTLAHTLLTGVRYTLTVAVGHRDVSGTFGGYSIDLLSAGTPVANQSGATAPGTGSFIDSSVEYAVQLSDVGNALGVRLGMPNSGNHVDYDNVRLSAELVNPIPTATISYTYDGSGQGSQVSSWPDSGGVELINGLLPNAAHYTDTEWVGFLDGVPDDLTEHPRVRFDLGLAFKLELAQVVYFHSTSQAGGTVTAPESVWVSVSHNGAAWSTPVQRTPFDSSSGDAIRTSHVDLSGLEGRFVRFDFRNTSPWTFLSEITFGGTTARGTIFLVK